MQATERMRSDLCDNAIPNSVYASSAYL